jgi:hypothetical protein
MDVGEKSSSEKEPENKKEQVKLIDAAIAKIRYWPFQFFL